MSPDRLEFTLIIRVCDWCGVVTLDDDRCHCAAPSDATQVRRRHREAVARARRTDLSRRGHERPEQAA